LFHPRRLGVHKGLGWAGGVFFPGFLNFPINVFVEKCFSLFGFVKWNFTAVSPPGKKPRRPKQPYLIAVKTPPLETHYANWLFLVNKSIARTHLTREFLANIAKTLHRSLFWLHPSIHQARPKQRNKLWSVDVSLSANTGSIGESDSLCPMKWRRRYSSSRLLEIRSRQGGIWEVTLYNLITHNGNIYRP